MKKGLAVIGLFSVNMVAMVVLFQNPPSGKSTIDPGMFTLICASLIGSVIGLLIGEFIKWFFKGVMFLGKTQDIIFLKLGFMLGFHLIASLLVAFFLTFLIDSAFHSKKNLATRNIGIAPIERRVCEISRPSNWSALTIGLIS